MQNMMLVNFCSFVNYFWRCLSVIV